MLRWRWVLLLWLIGLGMTAYGVLVELRVRSAMGGAFKSFLAGVFAGGQIEHYRWISQSCAIIGPSIILLAFLLRRNWDPEREADWLARRAAKRESKAAALRHRSRSLAAVDPDHARIVARRAERQQRRAEGLRRRAATTRQRAQN